MRALLSWIGGITGGLAAAELIVRLVTIADLDYASFVRPGLYCADPDVNVIAGCPGSFMMRVPGEERYIPLTLNQWGHRGPFSGGQGPALPKRIAIVGGQSQAFGSGLPDPDTYAAIAARAACGPVVVHNAAIVGVTNEVTWQLAERRLFQTEPPDHVILALYWRDGTPDIEGRVVEYAETMGIFGVLQGLEFYATRLAAPLRRSATLVRIYDQWARAEFGWTTSFGWRPLLTYPRRIVAEPMVGNPTLARLITRFAGRAAAMAVPFSVLLLPTGNDQTDAELKALLPDIRIIDTQAAIRANRPVDGLFPDAHYRRPTTDVIGRMIADEICDVDFPDAVRVRP